MSVRDDFPPIQGTTLDGRFVVQETLGSGGMGVVVAAKHLGLRRLVAIKLLRPEFSVSAEVVMRFVREARASARLKNEHVVTVLDVGTLETGIPYYVMDYLPGTDLGALIQKQGPLEVEQVVDYALQTLEALAEAHRAGIVHRDLKPPNLFLTAREDDSPLIKVLDFGVSKLIGWEVTGDGVVTRQGVTLGSPLYMPPEQLRDSSRVDARADIWALGAVMHELLTGRPPFDLQEVPALIRAICTERYRLPQRDDVPDELFEILFQCLRKDRAERFQDAEELARAFQPLVRTASAQVSIDRILRTRNSVPPLRVSPVPQPPLVSTDPEARLPSVTPVERDTPPSTPLRAPFWVGARAGMVVGVVWAAFVLGQYLARDVPTGTPPASAGNSVPPSAGVSPIVPSASHIASLPTNPAPSAPHTLPATPRLVPRAPSAPAASSSAVRVATAPAFGPSPLPRVMRVVPARDAGPASAAPDAPPAAVEGAASGLPVVKEPSSKTRRLDPQNPFARKLDGENPFRDTP